MLYSKICNKNWQNKIIPIFYSFFFPQIALVDMFDVIIECVSESSDSKNNLIILISECDYKQKIFVLIAEIILKQNIVV